jgi:hypothetical protein
MQVQYGSVVGLDAYMCFLLQVWRKLPRPRAKRAGRQAALRDLEEGRAPLLLSHRAGMGARGKFELPGNLHPVATGELQANYREVRSQRSCNPCRSAHTTPTMPVPPRVLLSSADTPHPVQDVPGGALWHDSCCFSPGGQER